MDGLGATGLLLLVLVFLLAPGVWIGMALLGTGVAAMILFTDRPIGDAMATTIWSHTSLWGLSALPLFILMGEILFRSKLSETLFAGLSPLMRRLPGGLLHVNIVGCSTFAAISGSSAATLMTVGKMTLPELRSRGYPDSLSAGTLAGAGTLGLLIPPSITMIIYGVTVQESIGRLFIAGILPGLMLAGLFLLYIFIWGIVTQEGRARREAPATFGEKLIGLGRLTPIVLLIALVIGSIYLGIASPTEAATIGVIGALALSALQQTLSVASLRAALAGTVKTTSMIMLLLAGSALLTQAMAFTGLPRTLAEWIGTLGLSPALLIAILTLFYIGLGCFLDGISMIVLTMAVIEPLVRTAGIDMIWFGVFVVLVGEMALITPPIGFNLFLVESMTGRGIGYISRAALPMFLLMLLGVVILVLVPELATWLPSAMMSRN
ncbi:MAG: TRAP transporter large permease subunit [Rhodospirillaceae bacterium]|nr:TRAP transporter large permease subunit [Rhodospirillaceae bacterium]MYH35846.1 TRAP transporter large permease subunit [Rhodospirillaceae bacterium]MYK16336.1 TRAP transporter large permease subunit [Rhodospirillaceae bacterium]MYK57167.1 TRAP transporter large permease subunit [Rhodospirillaceae bacterium]